MKRLIAILLSFSIAVSFAGCSSKEETAQSAETVEEIKVQGPETYITDIKYPGDIETGVLDTGKLTDIFKESSERYLWFNVNTETINEECSLYALDKESFKEKIEDKAAEDEINSYSDTTVRRETLETIEENAESIFSGYLTRGDGKNYIGYFESPFSAFGGQIIAGVEYSPDEYLKENGLDLYFRNAELKQIVCSDIMALSQWLVTAKVTATVDCYENSGMFSDIDWIPAKGMEDEVTFSVTFMSYYTKESDLHEVQVYDICVIEE